MRQEVKDSEEQAAEPSGQLDEVMELVRADLAASRRWFLPSLRSYEKAEEAHGEMVQRASGLSNTEKNILVRRVIEMRRPYQALDLAQEIGCQLEIGIVLELVRTGDYIDRAIAGLSHKEWEDVVFLLFREGLVTKAGKVAFHRQHDKFGNEFALRMLGTKYLKETLQIISLGKFQVLSLPVALAIIDKGPEAVEELVKIAPYFEAGTHAQIAQAAIQAGKIDKLRKYAAVFRGLNAEVVKRMIQSGVEPWRMLEPSKNYTTEARSLILAELVRDPEYRDQTISSKHLNEEMREQPEIVAAFTDLEKHKNRARQCIKILREYLKEHKAEIEIYIQRSPDDMAVLARFTMGELRINRQGVYFFRPGHNQQGAAEPISLSVLNYGAWGTLYRYTSPRELQKFSAAIITETLRLQATGSGTELEASEAPEGRGTEPEAASAPAGTGTEPESADLTNTDGRW